MSGNLVRMLTPEERELEKKRREVTNLEAVLADSELGLATLRAELHSFERKYVRVVGICYAQLDSIEAEIARIEAANSPYDAATQQRQRDAQARAENSAREADEYANMPVKADFSPSEALKRLYRELAKQMHPDMAVDDDDRERRHRFMAEVNVAYEDGDEERLKSILARWEGERAGASKDVGAILVALIRKIAHLEEALERIKRETISLQSSDLCKLHDRVTRLRRLGRDLLDEMQTAVRRKIAERQRYLAALRAREQSK